MNEHLKLAYDQGVQKALIDAGLTKESTFRTLAQYRAGKPFLEAAESARTPKDMVALMNSPTFRGIMDEAEKSMAAGVPLQGPSERLMRALGEAAPLKIENRHLLRAGGNELHPLSRKMLLDELKYFGR